MKLHKAQLIVHRGWVNISQPDNSTLYMTPTWVSHFEIKRVGVLSTIKVCYREKKKKKKKEKEMNLCERKKLNEFIIQTLKKKKKLNEKTLLEI